MPARASWPDSAAQNISMDAAPFGGFAVVAAAMQYFSTDIPQTASELFDGELVCFWEVGSV
jgi:hypothetical protein